MKSTGQTTNNTHLQEPAEAKLEQGEIIATEAYFSTSASLLGIVVRIISPGEVRGFCEKHDCGSVL